jgi:serine/threonine protein kinase/WD40 repeat protein
MPEWNPRANDLFVQAAEIDSPADRRLFLEQQCGGDAALQSQVESLLAAGGKIGSFLEKPALPAPPPGDATAAYRPLTEGPGTVIGPYKLLQHIGEGGFGAVYMAEQEHPVRRKVALKIIKLGMDTREVIARFESERQALAMMEHPNIARVFDAGATDSGRPYFVMELVRGVPITEFCDKNRFSAEQRLKLFVTVCNAIQHAHHKGIIHRDIKPSNVMVTLHDGVPVVKVIDFGVAKATAQKLTERTLFTAYGQMIGTPAYMSPEQAEMSGLDIDMRSDIFSLGVLLYELLTGTTPLDSGQLRKAGYAEMQRLIREEEAPRPSTRFSSMGGEATVLATNRGTDAKRLSQLLRSDLDWIVMKSLEKDRNRRYGSPATFAADVERYLKDEAVEACPPTLGYRLKKTYRRNRVAVLIGSAFALLLTVGVVAASLLAIRATNAERQAAADRDVAIDAEQTADREKLNALASRDELRHSLYVSDLQMAASLWQGKDRARTLEVLDRQRPQAGEPDLRGFEWHFLNRESRNEVRSLSLPEGMRRIPPDGRRVYLALPADRRKDGKPGTTIRSWDLKTGKELPEWEPFPGETASFLSIAGFSQTGDRALVGCRFGQPQAQPVEYRVLDLETHKSLFSLKEEQRMLPPLMDGEGRYIAVHKQDEKFLPESKVSIWNVAERKVERVISVDTTKGEMFGDGGSAFHPSGKQYAAVVVHTKQTAPSDVMQLQVWDVQSGSVVWRRPVEQGKLISRLVYSPDGKVLAEAYSEFDTIIIRNAEDGKILSKLRIPGVNNRSEHKFHWFSADGSKLAVSLRSQTGVHVWDLSTASANPDCPPLRSIPTDAAFNRAAFTEDSRSLIVAPTGTPDLSIYNLDTPVVTLPGPDAVRSSGPGTTKRPVNSSGLSPNNGRPVISSGLSPNNGLMWAVWPVESPDKPKAEVRVWDASGRVVFRVQCDSLEDWYTGTTTRDGKRFVLIQTSTHPTDPAQDRSRIQVWDLGTRVELSVGEIPGGRVGLWGSDPDGQTLVISRDQLSRPLNGFVVRTRLSCWDLAKNREIHGADIEGQLNGAAMNWDGTRVAWSLSLGVPKVGTELRVWDAMTGQEVWTRSEWHEPAGTTQLGTPVFSRDGRTLVVATESGSRGDQLFVLDATTGRDLLPPALSPDGTLHNLRVSADGRRLFALASTRQTTPRRSDSAVVWDLRTGRKLLTLPAENVSDLTIDREGRRIHLVKESVVSGKVELKLESLDGTPQPVPMK